MDEEQMQEEQHEEQPSGAYRAGQAVGGAARSLGASLSELLSGGRKDISVQPYLRRVPGAAARGVPPLTLASTLPVGILPISPDGRPELNENKDELADLFEVPEWSDNDMNIDGLVDFTPEDASDILEVDEEDVLGYEDPIEGGLRPSKPKARILERTNKPLPPTLTGMR